MVGCRRCPPYQCPLLGDLPTSAAGSCMAGWHAACPTTARAECRRKRRNQGAVSGLPDAAAPRYVAAVRFRLWLFDCSLNAVLISKDPQLCRALWLCLSRAHHWHARKWEVQTELGDCAGVFTGLSDKQVSQQPKWWVNTCLVLLFSISYTQKLYQ